MSNTRKMLVTPANAERITPPEGIVGPNWLPENRQPEIPAVPQGAVGPDWAPPNRKQSGEKKLDPIKEKIYDKTNRMLKIILKLASVNAYDETGRIKNTSGTSIENSDIVTLLNHALSKGTKLVAESEFVEMLHKGNVEPDLIINDNVRAKLEYLYHASPRRTQPRREPSPVLLRKEPIRPPVVRETHAKRRRDQVEDDIADADDVEPAHKRPRNESIKRKRPEGPPAWEIPLPEDDDGW
jgi:hypothetical protein